MINNTSLCWVSSSVPEKGQLYRLRLLLLTEFGALLVPCHNIIMQMVVNIIKQIVCHFYVKSVFGAYGNVCQHYQTNCVLMWVLAYHCLLVHNLISHTISKKLLISISICFKTLKYVKKTSPVLYINTLLQIKFIKGAFKYYVIRFSTILDPPPPPVSSKSSPT